MTRTDPIATGLSNRQVEPEEHPPHGPGAAADINEGRTPGHHRAEPLATTGHVNGRHRAGSHGRRHPSRAGHGRFHAVHPAHALARSGFQIRRDRCLWQPQSPPQTASEDSAFCALGSDGVTRPIEDYALIGDTEAAALVAKDGSIDWLCLPRFDSDACFAALLGENSHGRWKIGPRDPDGRVSRRYRSGTLVLETEFSTADGTVRLIDCMPIRRTDDEVMSRGRPDVIRVVEGVSGRVEMEMELTVRLGYGAIVPWVARRGGVWTAVGGPDALTLHTNVELVGSGKSTAASFSVGPSDRVAFDLAWFPSHKRVPEPIDPVQAIDDTTRWWENWSSHCSFKGPHRGTVLRSLITLKALTYAPTGGIVAAPTTSLPETLRGARNWDYRFVWLRDATFTLHALMMGGFREEAAAWRDWLLRAVAGDPAKLQIMYGIAGERRLPEMELGWLPGYDGSRPVRVGNAAYRQRQIDVYGEVIDALYVARQNGLAPDESAWDVQEVILAHLEDAWHELDHGLWEIRAEPRAFTHSRVMSWVAFDRAVKLAESTRLDSPVDTWRAVRDEIKAEVMEHGYDAERNTFTQSYGSRGVDAALLLLPQVGFIAPDDPRALGTLDAVQQDLGVDEALILRYRVDETDDGLPGDEGAFLICSFWLVDALALAGRTEEAEQRFKKLVGLSNDVGLLAEEYSPGLGRMLGNFPQAFSHIGLIDSAHTLVHAGPAQSRSR
jgi:GH15 family glucan-1,4-alpha-glucosidase